MLNYATAAISNDDKTLINEHNKSMFQGEERIHVI